MKIEFSSVDEALEFADRCRGTYHSPPHVLQNREDFASALFKIALGTPGDTKIQAIKAFRAATGEGLKASKDAVDAVWIRTFSR